MNGEHLKVTDNERDVYTTYSSTVLSYNASLLGTKNVEITDFTSVVTCNLSLTSSVIITAPEVSSTSLLLLEKFINTEIAIEETFKYYWDNYDNLFGRINIVYTNVDENGSIITDNNRIIKKNIDYMNEYYKKGYTLFIGFSRSTVLGGVLPWFETVGTKAKGISLNSSATSLNFPKPVFRLQNSDNKLFDSLKFILTDASKIYYIYSEGELATTNALKYLELLYPGKINSFQVKSDSSNLTLENIKELYKNVDNNSVSIMYMFIGTQQSDFVNVFNDSYKMPTSTFDVESVYPVIKKSSRDALIGSYNFLVNVSFSSAVLFREGLESLRKLFSTYVLNALLLITSLETNVDITTLPSDNSILEFNQNNDIEYCTFSINKYSKTDNDEYYYKQDLYSVYDPFVGEQIFDISQL